MPRLPLPGRGQNHVTLSATAFHRWAGEYAAAARSLGERDGFSPVPFLLRARALELLLKALLLTRGWSAGKLARRRVGDDLEKALRHARREGLDELVWIKAEELQEIRKANAYYRRRGFEYFDPVDTLKGHRELPDTRRLDALLERLLKGLEEVCRGG